MNARKMANPEPRYLSHRSKQQSMDPMSLDLDHILVIPKHPSLSIGTDDTEVLFIPKRLDDNELVAKNEVSSGVYLNPRGSRPYPQAVRMTEDPRLYINKANNQLASSRQELGLPSSTSLQPEHHFNKMEYVTREAHRLNTPFSSPPLSSGKSQKAIDAEAAARSKLLQNPLGEAVGTPKPMQVYFPKHSEHMQISPIKVKGNLLESRQS